MSGAPAAPSVRQSLAEAIATLNAAGIEAPARDARLLLAAALGVEASRVSMLIADQMPSQSGFSALIARRAAHEPVSKILGQRDFYGRSFRITADVLDPRPDTEALVSLALAAPFQHVLDLGTGSGCILLTLLAEVPTASGIGTDLSPAALKVAAKNAELLGLQSRARFAAGSWFAALGDGTQPDQSPQSECVAPSELSVQPKLVAQSERAGQSDLAAPFDPKQFDLIVSNPPYIAADEMAGLDPDVLRFDPHSALSDGGDGLSAYREITEQAAHHLRPKGRLMVEIGWQQGAAVAALFQAAGFLAVAVHPDLEGRDRVVSGIAPG